MNKRKEVASHIFKMVYRLDDKLSEEIERGDFQYISSLLFLPRRQRSIVRTLNELQNTFYRFEEAREDE